MSKNLGDRCCYFVATGFCFGLAPFMPGTFAALAGLLLHLAVIGWLPQAAHWPVTFALFLLFSVLCLAMNDWAERRWNVCDHQECFREVGSQGVAYTTGVPAMLGGKLMLEGKWKGAGVFNIEQLDPDPFMKEIGTWGLPWQETFLDEAFLKKNGLE